MDDDIEIIEKHKARGTRTSATAKYMLEAQATSGFCTTRPSVKNRVRPQQNDARR